MPAVVDRKSPTPLSQHNTSHHSAAAPIQDDIQSNKSKEKDQDNSEVQSALQNVSSLSKQANAN